MMRSASQLFKSILLSSSICKPEMISKRIAELFNLKLILSKELEKEKKPGLNDMAPLIYQELNKNACRSWLLDGFPRTKLEAEQLWKEQKCHVVINLRLPHNLLVAQANKIRFVHPASGRTYNLEFNPPKRKGRDDITGEELVQDEDFSPEEIKEKILEHEERLKPVVDFYRQVGILQEIHGNSTADLINKSRICLSSVLPDKIM